MSKSPNIFLPAFGVTALALGGAWGISQHGHGEMEIASLKDRLEVLETRTSESVATAKAADARAEKLVLRVAEAEEVAKMASENGGSLTMPAPKSSSGYGLGRPALQEEIIAWDVDILPDGRGLPVGSGDVFTGEEVFADKCASCHGDFAEGVDNWPVLAGGFNTLADEDPVKTVGSYWPYLSTVWDYVHRSMPFGAAQTLTDDETYAIVAYILYSNDLVDEEFTLSNETFTSVELPNAGGFIVDDRAKTEYTIWSGEPCMSDCKDKVEITRRASDVNVTPMDSGVVTTEMMEAGHGSDQVAEAETAGGDDALFAAGEKLFKKCKACHTIGEGASNKTGPMLNGIMTATMGTVEGFKYSNGFKAAAEEGRTWDAESMAAFLTKPKQFMKGTKMSFAGFKKAEDLEAIIKYLEQAGQ